MRNDQFRMTNSNMNWLPDMDLNHDKVIQSHLCYRYTIGQAGASRKLKSFTVQSRRQTAATRRNTVLARDSKVPGTRRESLRNGFVVPFVIRHSSFC